MRDALLLLGGALIIASALYTLTHLTDTVVLTVLLPGFALGFLLIGIWVSLGKDRGRRRGE